MLTTLLTLTIACGDRGEGAADPWPYQKGTAAAIVLDADIDTLPASLPCEGGYTVQASHAFLVDDCGAYSAHAYENPICDAAVAQASEAARTTRCPEPPPVYCPQRIRETWRGWRCGENPGLAGQFANCSVQVRLSCNQ